MASTSAAAAASRPAPESDDEDSELLKYVLQMSLMDYNTKEKQRSQAIGLEEWRQSSDNDRLALVKRDLEKANLSMAGEALSEYPADLSNMSYEEQMQYALDMSKREHKQARATNARSEMDAIVSATRGLHLGTDSDRPLAAETEEEEVARALALSCDPSEQENDFIRDLLRAVQASTRSEDHSGLEQQDEFRPRGIMTTTASASSSSNYEDFGPRTSNRAEKSEEDFRPRAEMEIPFHETALPYSEHRDFEPSLTLPGPETGAISKNSTLSPTPPNTNSDTISGILDIPSSPEFDDDDVKRAIEESKQSEMGFDEREVAIALQKSKEVDERKRLLDDYAYEDLFEKRAQEPGAKRPIAIDGNNVAFYHGNNERFSPEGLEIALRYFLKLGHETVKIFATKKFWSKINAMEMDLLHRLKNAGFLVWIEPKLVDRQYVAPYDDLAILDYAERKGAVVVTNDKFRDIQQQYPKYIDIIRKRCTTYTFVEDDFFIPEDPCGRNGPKRDDFLKF